MVGGTRPGVGRLARQGLGIVRSRFDCFLNGATTGGSCGGGGVGFVEEEPLPRACVEESEGEDSLMGVVDKDFARSLSSESSVQATWIEVSRTLVHQLLGRGARYGSLAGGEVGKQLFVSNPSYPPSSPLRHPLLAGGVRFKGTKMSKKGLKRKKAREVRLKLKKIRKEKKAKKAAMSPEQRLEHGIYKLRKKIALHEEQIKKKYQLPEFPEPDPDTEILTPEQLYALKKLGYKNKNYVPVGRRGIYGGTIQNLHMHWKKHETVRLCCDNFPKEKIKDMGKQLERLSGGTVIDIHQAKTIIMWRGRNYKRPEKDIPEVFKHFNKRKALLKSKHEQAINSLYENIRRWEKDLKDLRADMARKKAADARWAAENPGVPNPKPAFQQVDQPQNTEYISDDDGLSDSAIIYDSDGEVLNESTDSDSESDSAAIYDSDGEELEEYTDSDSDSETESAVLDEGYELHGENYDSVSDSEHDGYWDNEYIPDGEDEPRSEKEVCVPPKNGFDLHQIELKRTAS